MSIDDLARAAKIAPSSVERIERDELDPGITVLMRMAGCLNVRLGTLLDGIESTLPVVTRRGKAMDGDRSADIDLDDRRHLKYHSLSAGKYDRNMEPYIVDVEYLPDWQQHLHTHEGEEFIYVLEGEVTVHYGSSDYFVGQDESIYFESVVPHSIGSASPDTVAKVVSVFYAPQ